MSLSTQIDKSEKVVNFVMSFHSHGIVRNFYIYPRKVGLQCLASTPIHGLKTLSNYEIMKTEGIINTYLLNRLREDWDLHNHLIIEVMFIKCCGDKIAFIINDGLTPWKNLVV